MRIDIYRVACALRVAAEQYKKDAHDALCHPGGTILAKQFESQAREAFNVADALEHATIDIVEKRPARRGGLDKSVSEHMAKLGL